MLCDRGIPWLFNPDGSVAYCLEEGAALDIATVADRVDYFSNRVVDWAQLAGAVAGLLVLMLTVVAVSVLLKR